MQRLTRWGNSTGLRLSADVMQASGLRPGDYVQVRLLDSGEIRVRAVGLVAQQRAAAMDADEPLATPQRPKVMEW